MAFVTRLRAGPWTMQPNKCTIAWANGGYNAAQSIDLLQNGSNAPVGIYEVSLFAAVNTTGTSGTLRVNARCTGLGGDTIYSLPAQDITVTGGQSGIFLIDSDGSSPMVITFTLTGTAGALRFSWRAIVNLLDTQTITP